MQNNILYIINILRLYSSKEHPLSIADIVDQINNHYSYNGKKTSKSVSNAIDSSSVGRALKTYICTNSDLNDMQMPDYDTIYFNPVADFNQYSNLDISKDSTNFKIHVLIDNPNQQIDGYQYKDITNEYIEMVDNDIRSKKQGKKKKKSPKTYYYYEPNIPISEIKNLISMVETHPYYSSQEVGSICEFLKSISPGYFLDFGHYKKNVKSDSEEALRADNARLQANLHELHQLINSDKDICIEYSYYNEKKELVPRNGYCTKDENGNEIFHRITPLYIVWANGYCYLVAFNPHQKHFTNYRVDRITHIESAADNNHVVEENTEMKQKYMEFKKGELQYIKERPAMMSGDPIEISLLCKKRTTIIQNLLDTFGMNINIKPATPEKIKEVFPNRTDINCEDWWDVTCPGITEDGATFCARQFYSEAVLYKPANIVERIKENLSTATNLYNI